MHQGKHERAIRRLEKAKRIQESTYGVDHILNAETIMYMGVVLRKLERHDEADCCLEKCQHILGVHLGYDHPRIQKLKEEMEEEIGQTSGPNLTMEPGPI
jgi:hypothetical protein